MSAPHTSPAGHRFLPPPLDGDTTPHHPHKPFPASMFFVQYSGNCVAFSRKPVIPEQASQQASNGQNRTYQPAKKKPTG
ncbi:hypothetical protein JTE90_012320 [Oedothorax gibbosus]|uniref:Uncharacterized protein n=1 Tax=Oedothorax gibbosus TaxID=931172 RepID=A0AAV6VIR5_9ARAC|nr:hypothetical protein JTE90_012320 [Oedothorax gibbosus]